MARCIVCGYPNAPDGSPCPQCGRANHGAPCPTCGQPAPTLYRAGKVLCAGCGATRGVLSGLPLNMAGTAHKVGGVVTGVVAWLGIAAAVFTGSLVALVTWLFTHAWGTTLLAGGVVGGLGALLGGLVLLGARSLSRRGDQVRQEALQQSVLAMAASRHGRVTTVEVAQNLSLALRDADQLLTAMTFKGHAQVEVNAEGLLQYSFRDLRGAASGAPLAGAGASTGVRVETASPQDAARERVTREFDAMAERHRTGRL